MTKLSRSVLISYFKNGRMPQEGNFEDLIDSTVNILDDGFSKSKNGGLLVAPDDPEPGADPPAEKRMVSFFTNTESMSENMPAWYIALTGKEQTPDLTVVQPDPEGDPVPALVMQNGGGVGIHTSTPEYTLDINGVAGMHGRVGTYRQQAANTVPADGRWHAIVTGLDSLNGFEVMAAVYGVKGSGKYALLHAIALSAFGGSHNRINCTQSHYGRRKHRLDLRWTGSTHSYNLEIRTRSDFGKDIMIRYYLTRLWWDGL